MITSNMQLLVRQFVVVTVVQLCTAAAAASSNKSLFALNVFEGETGAVDFVFSYKSLVSGHGRLKRLTDSPQSVFEVEGACRVGDEDFDLAAGVEFESTGTGYAIRTEAKLQSATGIIATYLLDAQRSYTCPRLMLRHNLTTVPDHLIAFSSGATETCESENRSRLEVDIDLSSSLSPLLTTELRQIFVFDGASGWESMNATNPAMLVNVSADWRSDLNGYYHKKTAKFDSKALQWLVPSFSLEYENLADRIIVSILKQATDRARDEL